jgi:myo-inositol-1(or 4)-monophosphatase
VRTTLERLGSRVRATRTLGSAALSLAWVGAGRLDGFVRPAGIQPLDVMAGALVAVEAGASVGDPRGDPWPELGQPGVTLGIVAGGRLVHDAVVRLFGASR